MENSAWHSFSSGWSPRKDVSYDSPVYRDKYGMFTSTKTSRTYSPPRLYDRNGVVISHLDYLSKMKDRSYRVIDSTFVDDAGVYILTVWEGRHPSGVKRVAGDKPLIFKTTMFIAEDTDDTMYLAFSSSERDAEAAHAKAIVFAKNIRMSEDSDEEEEEEG